MNPKRFAILRDIFEERVVFNKVLGLKLLAASDGRGRIEFEFKPELVGNFNMRILHGGVISTALDVVGAIAVQASFKDDAPIYSMGTVDLRTDFLRPGHGTRFVATGQVMRPGRILCSTRMELVNEAEELIAIGTGIYRVTSKEEFASVNL